LCLALSNSDPTADCTLREAITAANGDPNTAREIDFNIPSSGVQTITLDAGLGVLPAVRADGTFINGYTQPGSSPNANTNDDNAVVLIELKGSGLTTGTNDGIVLDANGATVYGLAIGGFNGSGVLITERGYGSAVQGSFIGTDSTGSAALANGIGVKMDGSAFALIGCEVPEERNVISGNLNQGVVITGGASVNAVQGNFIGLGANGARALDKRYGRQ
jgi:hypothetical protein